MRSRVFAVVFMCALAAASQPMGAQPNSAAGRWTVVFTSETAPANAAALIASAGGRLEAAINEIGVVTASGNAAFAARIAKVSGVLAVGTEGFRRLPAVTRGEEIEDAAAIAEPETFGAPTGADTFYKLYGWNVRRIGAPAMWARVPLEVQNTVTVAVLDTGLAHNHPDFTGQIAGVYATNYCQDTVGGNPAYPIYRTLIDFDANPEWDPSMGCTAASLTFNSHGSHVAGTIAARFGGAGIVGVAPGVRIAAYKVFDRYRFTDDDGELVDDVGAFDGPVFRAIVDAADRGYEVINMSLGGTIDRRNSSDNAGWLAYDRVVKYATRKGTVIVAAAGNSGENSNGRLAHVPSDLPGVISVSATGSNNLALSAGMYDALPGSDVLAFYSNTGAAKDVSAPGGDCGPGYPASCAAPYFIWSVYIFESGPNAGALGYAGMAGTSMAAPHVAAVTAIVRALHPELNPGEVRSFIKETADDLGWRQAFGHGIVNADTASR